MPKTTETEWCAVRAKKTKMEKLFDLKNRQVVFDLKSFCIECGQGSQATSFTRFGSPQGLKQAHEISVPFTVKNGDDVHKIPVVTRLYLCKKHAEVLESQNNLEKWSLKIIIFFFFAFLLAGAMISGASDYLPPSKLFLFITTLTGSSFFLYILILLISRKIFHSKFSRHFRVVKEGKEDLLFYFRVPENAAKMTNAYGLELYNPTRAEHETKVEKSLVELPVISPDQVPTSRQPFREGDGAREFSDSKAAARHLLYLYPPVIRHDHISFYERGGGVAKEYSIYRIAESTWRLVEDFEFTD